MMWFYKAVLETYVHFSKDAVKFTHLYSICIQCSKHVCNLVSTCWILISCLMSKKIFTFTSSQWAGTFHLVWLDTKLRPLDISKSQYLHQSPLLAVEFVICYFVQLVHFTSHKQNKLLWLLAVVILTPLKQPDELILCLIS